MLKRLPRRENALLSFKLAADVYTLAQMRRNCLLEFFDVFQDSPEWREGLDLNQAQTIFCAFAAEARFKPLIDAILPEGRLVPNARPVPRRMLSAIIEADHYGANLVELGDTLESVEATLIKANLDPREDRQTIYDHELTGMIGDPEKLRRRLLRYFESGVNWDDAKSFLFQGIPLPPPTRAR